MRVIWLPARMLDIPAEPEGTQAPTPKKKRKEAKKPSGNQPHLDLKKELKRICGVDLTSIDRYPRARVASPRYAAAIVRAPLQIPVYQRGQLNMTGQVVPDQPLLRFAVRSGAALHQNGDPVTGCSAISSIEVTRPLRITFVVRR